MSLKALTLTLTCIILVLKCFSQDDPIPIGYKLNKTRNLIRAYQDNGGVPDLTRYKFWNFDYWFLVDDDNVDVSGVAYVRIFIKSGAGVLITPTPWTNVDNVDSRDFNSFLYIKKTDFNTHKADEFPKYSGRFILSALTVPFKIRPAIGEHASSLYNSNFNIGTFLGARLAHKNRGGATFGLMLGVASQDQNSSTNSAITDSSSQTMTSVNYGLGLIFDVAKKFQIGGVVGWDKGYGDLSKTYIYQHKPWFALSLNFNFLDFGGKNEPIKQP